MESIEGQKKKRKSSKDDGGSDNSFKTDTSMKNVRINDQMDACDNKILIFKKSITGFINDIQDSESIQ